MLFTPAHAQEDKDPEKQEFISHAFIVPVATVQARRCVAGVTRRKDRYEPLCARDVREKPIHWLDTRAPRRTHRKSFEYSLQSSPVGACPQFPDWRPRARCCDRGGFPGCGC